MGRFSFKILKPLLHSIRATKPLLPIIEILRQHGKTHRRRADDAHSYLFCVRCSSSRANADLTAHNGKPNDCTSCEQTLGIFVSTSLTYIFACFLLRFRFFFFFGVMLNEALSASSFACLIPEYSNDGHADILKRILLH